MLDTKNYGLNEDTGLWLITTIFNTPACYPLIAHLILSGLVTECWATAEPALWSL